MLRPKHKEGLLHLRCNSPSSLIWRSENRHLGHENVPKHQTSHSNSFGIYKNSSFRSYFCEGVRLTRHPLVFMEFDASESVNRFGKHQMPRHSIIQRQCRAKIQPLRYPWKHQSKFPRRYQRQGRLSASAASFLSFPFLLFVRFVCFCSVSFTKTLRQTISMVSKDAQRGPWYPAWTAAVSERCIFAKASDSLPLMEMPVMGISRSPSK